MLTNINTKVLMSLAAIGVAGALIIGATIAFFSDTESSQGNTLKAGALDLKIDSEAHYGGLVCALQDQGPSLWEDDQNSDTPLTRPDLEGFECEGTWEETDLGGTSHKFFNLSDLKPGDSGENTISIHVYTNDSWGRLVVENVQDLDNDCTEPEGEDELGGVPNPNPTPGCTAPDGELREALLFSAWLDQGAIPGFQNIDANGNPVIDTPDQTEGDNIRQIENDNNGLPLEPIVITPGDISTNPAEETHNFWEGLAPLRAAYNALGVDNPCADSDSNNDGQTLEPSVTTYGPCQGLALDGRLVGSTTYYLGVLWELPSGTDDRVQTDSLVADVRFDAVQHRNNPGPTPTF